MTDHIVTRIPVWEFPEDTMTNREWLPTKAQVDAAQQWNRTERRAVLGDFLRHGHTAAFARELAKFHADDPEGFPSLLTFVGRLTTKISSLCRY